jgi:uncharacterized protein
LTAARRRRNKAGMEPFWQRKPLAAMTPREWESLCDGCGRCCLVKFEDEDTGEIAYTDVSCKLLDTGSCRCSDYRNRAKIVDDCVKLTPANVGDLAWLPTTCAYRILDEGGDLPWWHPLVSGDPETVVTAGVSMRGRAVSERDVAPDAVVRRIRKLKPAKRRPHNYLNKSII